MVARVWRRAGLKPHRLERYMASDDPDFERKAADVIGLYVNPPQHAAVLCVDENRNGCAIDGDEGPATARRFVVDCTCGQLFPRTALASNDYRHARGSSFFDQAYGPAYR